MILGDLREFVVVIECVEDLDGTPVAMISPAVADPVTLEAAAAIE